MVNNTDVLPALSELQPGLVTVIPSFLIVKPGAWVQDGTCHWGYTEFPESVPLVIGMNTLITIIAVNVDHSPSAQLGA